MGYGFNRLLFMIGPKELISVWFKEVQCRSQTEQSAYIWTEGMHYTKDVRVYMSLQKGY